MSDVPLRLHIGGETAKEGWTILNVQPGPHVDTLGDCRDLSAYSDGAVTEIYASHVFESSREEIIYHPIYVTNLKSALPCDKSG